MDNIKKINWKRFSYVGLAILVVFALLFSGLQLSLEKSANNQVKVVLTVGNPIDAYTGTVDYTGLTDTAVQQAIDALPAAGGEVNLISPAYTFTGTVSRAINNVKISGVNGTTITYAGACFSVGAQTGWVFEDVKIAVGGSITNFANAELRNVTIGATYYTLRAPNTTGNIAAPSITDSGLTSGQVVYSGTGGLLSSEAGFEYNAGTNTFTAGQITDSGLTAGYVPYAGTGGLLSNESNFAYNATTNTLDVDNLSAPTGRGATYVIAASNATALEKAQADYVFTGVVATDTTQFQSIITSMPANGGLIKLTSGTFHISSAITAVRKYLHLQGAGQYSTSVIQDTVDTNAFTIGSTATDTPLSSISDMSITTTGTGSCIKTVATHHSRFSNLTLTASATGHGIWLDGSILNEIADVLSYGGLAGFYQTYNVALAITCNKNVFLNCHNSGGVSGFYTDDQHSQGDSSFISCESSSNTLYGFYAYSCNGIYVDSLHLETGTVTMHLESIRDSNIQLSYSHGIEVVNCANTNISGGVNTASLNIDAASLNVKVKNMRIAGLITNLSPTSNIENVPRSSALETNLFWGVSKKGYSIDINSGLEIDNSGVPLYYTNFNGATITRTGTGLVDTTKYSGNYAYLIAKSAAPTNYKGLNFRVPSKFKGQYIEVEAWIKSVSAAYAPIIQGWLDAGASINGLSAGLSTEWQKVQGTIYYDPTKTTLDIFFGCPYTDATASFYLDQIKIWADFNPNIPNANIHTGSYIASGEVRTAEGTLTAGNANAIGFAWHNPEAQDILIKKVVVYVTTGGGTAGSHLDVGIADDATGTNRGTEFFDNLTLETIAVYDSTIAAGGGTQTVWVFCQDSASATDGWVVGQILDANAASLVGRYYIEYVGY